MVIRNKRGGSIAFGLLVILCIFLMLMGWFSFLTFNDEAKGSLDKASKLMMERDFAHTYVLSLSKEAFKEAVILGGERGINEVIINFKENVLKKEESLSLIKGNFFGKVRNGDFKIERIENNYLLSINGLFVESGDGMSRFKRNFNIEYKETFNDESLKEENLENAQSL
jgi:hypothetical protein